MGVLNVTPDSFSNQGEHFSYTEAVAHAKRLIDEGADIIDVGGEATNPWVEPTPEAEELRRVIPVIEAIRRVGITIPISVDTMKAGVAAAAIDAGANLINDVSGFRDPAMIAVAVDKQVPICVMHMQGTPKTMQLDPQYPKGVVNELLDWGHKKAEELMAAGVKRENIILDPGIGFGKTVAHNYEIIHNLHKFKSLGFPLLLGASRKSFLGKVLNKKPQELDFATVAAHTAAIVSSGVEYIRVHNVQAHRDAVEVVTRIMQS
ncbi:MAG: dihydropteroate synthase [Chlamydiales bacterium]|nr:dihydropteroate synthase [Chlamydiia bacterium]MCP5506714.1 dihydropteroate synthase [Chlamydiales bacterium]